MDQPGVSGWTMASDIRFRFVRYVYVIDSHSRQGYSWNWMDRYNRDSRHHDHRDLESFPQHWTQQVGDDADDVVDCYGMEKDSAIVIQWGDTEDFYTVTSQGLGGEEYGMDASTVDWLEDIID